MSADVNDYSMSVYELGQNFTLALALMPHNGACDLLSD